MGKFIDSVKKKVNGNKKKIRILFTEGWNNEIQNAAIQLKKENIIEPILLLKKKINKNKINGIKTIIIDEINNEPNVEKLYDIRKEKNLSYEEAKKLANEPNYLSTILLKRKIVDGVVCGIEYTTKETIKSALQIIGKNKKNKIVSSAMFIEINNDLLIFGDCSLNINPNYEELANIAIDIAKLANKLILNKKINVALLSYSTNGSGSGESVDKVKSAYSILKNKKIKNINFYGEIQFDAAINKQIRNKKIKNLNWNKNAQIFIFPNLDSSNIGYKILEQCVDDAVAIGPVLIGLDKPMNDLSRGSSLESIIAISYITAFQAIK